MKIFSFIKLKRKKRNLLFAFLISGVTFFLFQNFSAVEQKKLNTDYNDLFKANPQNCRPKNICELYNLQAKSFSKDLKEAIKEIKKKKDQRTISYMNVIGKEVKLVRTLEQWQSIY